MEKQYDAIVLMAKDTNENDKTITLLTNCGIISCTLRGVKKPNAKLKAATLPLAYGEYSIVSKGNVVVGFESKREFNNILADYEVFVVASVACECAYIGAFLEEQTQTLKNGLLLALTNMSTALSDKSQVDCNYCLHQILIEFVAFVLSISGYHKDYSTYGIKQILNEFEQTFEKQLKSKKLLLNL